MRVETLLPDVAPRTGRAPAHGADAFERVVNGLGSLLTRAQSAEDRFAAGSGDLQTAVYERARADVALAVATAAAQRTAQALQSMLNMQV